MIARDVKEKLYEIDSKQIELDFLQQQFLVECKRFVAQCMETLVRKAILANPEFVIEMGKEKLSPIKTKVNQLMNDISEKVNAIIGQADLWLHTQTDLNSDRFPVDYYQFRKNSGPEPLESAIKSLLSPIGRLLMESRLDIQKNWQENDGSYLFRHHLDWSREMRESMEKYSVCFNELSALVKEYEVLSEQSAGNKALDLWDSLP